MLHNRGTLNRQAANFLMAFLKTKITIKFILKTITLHCLSRSPFYSIQYQLIFMPGLSIAFDLLIYMYNSRLCDSLKFDQYNSVRSSASSAETPNDHLSMACSRTYCKVVLVSLSLVNRTMKSSEKFSYDLYSMACNKDTQQSCSVSVESIQL